MSSLPPPAPPRPLTPKPAPVPTTYTLSITMSDSAFHGDIIRRFSMLVAEVSEKHVGHVVGVGVNTGKQGASDDKIS